MSYRGAAMSPLFGRGKRDDEQTGDDHTRRLPDLDRFLPAGQDDVFRAMRTARGTDPSTGKAVFRSGIGVSKVSKADADAIAAANAQQILDQTLRHEAIDAYAYMVDRAIEPLVETVTDGPLDVGRVTVNSYGSVVLNAYRALFVDVDNDEGAPVADPTRALEELVRDRPELAFRVYRTHAGWRYLCTTQEFDPVGDGTRALLEQLGSDRKYAILCRVQRCFRARLTPKPWRAGSTRMDVLLTRALSRGTLERELRKTAGYAAARYERTVGDASRVAPEIAPILEYHDRWSQSASAKPLA
jgi:hypothetical protein